MDHRMGNLSINMAGQRMQAADDPVCNPGGSWICWTPTQGCGTDPPMTCFGTSTQLEKLDVMVSLPPDQLAALHTELADFVTKFVARSGK
jgi:hypothetical protein